MFMMLNRILFYSNKIVKNGLVQQTCSSTQLLLSDRSHHPLTPVVSLPTDDGSHPSLFQQTTVPIHPFSGEMPWCPERSFWNSQMSCFRFHRFLICITAVIQFCSILLWCLLRSVIIIFGFICVLVGICQAFAWWCWLHCEIVACLLPFFTCSSGSGDETEIWSVWDTSCQIDCYYHQGHLAVNEVLWMTA
jgi:hypothetical protein